MWNTRGFCGHVGGSLPFCLRGRRERKQGHWSSSQSQKQSPQAGRRERLGSGDHAGHPMRGLGSLRSSGRSSGRKDGCCAHERAALPSCPVQHFSGIYDQRVSLCPTSKIFSLSDALLPEGAGGVGESEGVLSLPLFAFPLRIYTQSAPAESGDSRWFLWPCNI